MTAESSVVDTRATIMIKPLKSFGCSFIYGTDLNDCDGTPGRASNLTYPALIASRLQLEYSSRAGGGRGNLFILETILRSIKMRAHREQSPWIINWTYIDRFDYQTGNSSGMNWQTILPMLDDVGARTYHRNFHTELLDKFRSLTYIYTAVQALTMQNISFVMTYMDHLLFDTQFTVPPAVEWLQAQVQDHMTTFDGTDFLTWSRDQGYAISANGHPLESAHAAAADYLTPVIESILHKA